MPDKVPIPSGGPIPDAGADASGALGAAPAAAAGPRDAASLCRSHPALAPLAPFLDDGRITDAFVNGERGLFLDRGVGCVREARWRAAEADVRAMAVALVALGGRHLDEASPCVDVRLGDGIRVHAVLPPVSRSGTLISVRIPSRAVFDVSALEAAGMLDAASRAGVERLVAERVNVLITGAAGSGKTTLLGAMLALVPAGERIVTVEDVAELRVAHPHHVALEARQPNLEGVGGIGLDRLVREALRMRPDRLVVGECRGAEILDLLGALNTGHDGGAGTVHANSLEDVPARLEALALPAGLGRAALAGQVASAIGRVVHLRRGLDGVRRIAAVGVPTVRGRRLEIRETSWL